MLGRARVASSLGQYPYNFTQCLSVRGLSTLAGRATLLSVISEDSSSYSFQWFFSWCFVVISHVCTDWYLAKDLKGPSIGLWNSIFLQASPFQYFTLKILASLSHSWTPNSILWDSWAVKVPSLCTVAWKHCRITSFLFAERSLSWIDFYLISEKRTTRKGEVKLRSQFLPLISFI